MCQAALQHSLERGRTTPPPTAVIVEMKYCETCGRPFQRRFTPTVVTGHKKQKLAVVGHGYLECDSEIRRDKGRKYCDRCLYMPLDPQLQGALLAEEQEKYKEQMPDSIPVHFIRYPREAPVGRQTQAHQLSRHLEYRDRWKKSRENNDKERALLRAAFAARGVLSTEDLQEVLPHCYGLDDVQDRLLCLSMRKYLVRAGSRRRPGVQGKGIALYIWPGVSPTTIQ